MYVQTRRGKGGAGKAGSVAATGRNGFEKRFRLLGNGTKRGIVVGVLMSDPKERNRLLGEAYSGACATFGNGKKEAIALVVEAMGMTIDELQEDCLVVVARSHPDESKRNRALDIMYEKRKGWWGVGDTALATRDVALGKRALFMLLEGDRTMVEEGIEPDENNWKHPRFHIKRVAESKPVYVMEEIIDAARTILNDDTKWWFVGNVALTTKNAELGKKALLMLIKEHSRLRAAGVYMDPKDARYPKFHLLGVADEANPCECPEVRGIAKELISKLDVI